jgi:hypothetical protein
MLFNVKVFRLLGNKRKWIFTKEIPAENMVQALERSCIRFSEDRIVEISQFPKEERKNAK